MNAVYRRNRGHAQCAFGTFANASTKGLTGLQEIAVFICKYLENKDKDRRRSDDRDRKGGTPPFRARVSNVSMYVGTVQFETDVPATNSRPTANIKLTRG